ncbi:long-chain fatty acid--CoA ligase [Bacteroidales bacterium OttesenSCG-928-A17]|nr:long-chain fatty acid--CoA ligase [Bacteroidales bacterium OttesenSCG-928-A17]
MNYTHLSQIISSQTKKYGEEEVLRTRNDKTQTWTPISWKDFSQKVTILAQSICHFGIKPQEHIGVYSQNMAECIYIDFAAFSNRAITVPMYPTASVPQISYMIEEAEISLIFVGEQSQYDNARQAQEKSKFLKLIVILDPEVVKEKDDKTSLYFDSFCSIKNRTSQDIVSVEKRIQSAQPEDIAHLIYTSGTTGESKGAMLTHSNYLEVFRIHDIRLDYLPQRFSSISFLPMAHIFEKAWSLYCLYRGCTVAINKDPREIQKHIKEVKPEAMCSVPRFWEKVYAGVQQRINESGFFLRLIFRSAISTGRKHNLNYINNGKKPPMFLSFRYKLYNKTIYNTLKKVIGIENGMIFPCAGAYLSDKITEFLRSVNIPLVVGYGLTETTATVSCFPPIGYEIGTVGKIMPEVEVRIGQDYEIQIKGKTVTKGYYKKPWRTKEAFTEDGWFRTGDAGSLTENNSIILKERIKDLYKTSNGKYIAPQQLEGRLMDDPFIEGAVIIGDQRKYVSAMIIPDFIELEKYAKSHHIPYENQEELISKKEIEELYGSRIAAIQNEFASFEQIKRFTLLSEPFTIEGGELTNTLKMKRAFIAEKYKERIEEMYPPD